MLKSVIKLLIQFILHVEEVTPPEFFMKTFRVKKWQLVCYHTVLITDDGFSPLTPNKHVPMWKMCHLVESQGAWHTAYSMPSSSDMNNHQWRNFIKQVVKVIWQSPHCRRTRMVESCSLCQPHGDNCTRPTTTAVDKLICRREGWQVGRRVLSPKNCPFTRGDLDPI